MGRGVWDPPGGIAQLVRIIDKHGRALEYDLMTRAGFTLEDVPSRVSFRALLSFVSHLGADSELVAELKPELAGWQGAQRVPMMLADVIDLLNNIGYMYASSHRGKGKPKPKQPRPYRRPGAKGRQPEGRKRPDTDQGLRRMVGVGSRKTGHGRR